MRYFVPVLVALLPMAIGYGVWHFMSDSRIATDAWISPDDGQARLEGKRLYDAYCASCHGVHLQGEPKWRDRMANGRLPAPPHDVSGHTWHHSDAQLIEMIKIGFMGGVNAPRGYQSDMPAFGSILSDEQIRLILAYIKSSWPEQALAAQKEISLNRE
ncbi:c-type cytochrome [Orrella daihaiensis]|uniref:Cytochrome c n=1 Tax=Orrella daihaiensis TaxID=2782176 RepID=A0ABY4AMV8_9BURK|nr:cytochrome c [Orrella daihaiensis]UOD51612.1 cytochrome c [Orrella daihaiensis]